MKALTVSLPLKLFPGLREIGECAVVLLVAEVVAITLADEGAEEGRLESPTWVVAGVEPELPPVNKEEQSSV